MKRTCDLFNRYRDGTLGKEQKLQFESHLANCDECRKRSTLLNNLIHFIQDQEIRDVAARSEQIADRAYEYSNAWEAMFLSLMRPAQAWSGLAVLLLFLSFLWVAPQGAQPVVNDYDSLISADDQIVNAVATLPDAEFEIWLVEGGYAK